MKLCINCKHSEYCCDICQSYNCKRSIKYKIKRSLVDGKQITFNEDLTCISERSHNWIMARILGKCGMEGRYFESKV